MFWRTSTVTIKDWPSPLRAQGLLINWFESVSRSFYSRKSSGKIMWNPLHGCFQKILVPQNGWFIMENPIKMMIWGYHYFWKHRHHSTSPFNDLSALYVLWSFSKTFAVISLPFSRVRGKFITDRRKKRKWKLLPTAVSAIPGNLVHALDKKLWVNYFRYNILYDLPQVIWLQ